MTGVKSFRIDDLLVKKTRGSLEDTLKTESVQDQHETVSNRPISKHELDHTKTVQMLSDRYHPPSEDSRLETRYSDKKEVRRSPHQEDKKGYDLSSHATILPYNPMIFPMGTAGSSGSTFGSEAGMKSHGYPNILPYSFESSRLGQPRNYGRMEAAMLPTSFSPFHGQFPSSMEYMYPSYIGHFGVPIPSNMGDNFHEKRQFMNDRLHYSMYPLGRSLYTTTCKRKGGQIRFNNSQTAQLEKAFVQQKYLNANDRKKLAQSLGLSDRQVKTWFQNRRAKLRKCKGGTCTESEVSGSPLDSRATSPYENDRYDSPLDVKGDN